MRSKPANDRKEQKWNNDCLNGRIDWLIGHVDENDSRLIDTDQKQWEQLEDHRKRMDGFDAAINDFMVTANEFRTTDEDLELTNQKQWKQLEDHRKRLDGLEAQIFDESQQYKDTFQKLIQEQQEYLNRMNELEILVKTIQNSYSFKLGRIITYLPRKLLALLKK